MRISPLIPLFSLSLFLSAGLLFSVQPMIGRMLLPFLGGGPSVWNAALLFFQITLLLGYLYAHISAKFLPLKTQAILQAALLAVFFLLRPLTLPENLELPESGQTFWQLKIMLLSIGGPFFVLAASAPLLQNWFSRSNHSRAKSPYFLYAVSNAGSLIALLAYPVYIEPLMTLAEQKYAWLAGFGLLIFLTTLCAMSLKENPAENASLPEDKSSNITWVQRFCWLILALIPSSVMLGYTSHITMDIAPAPLLWVIPLAYYLLTFIIAFSGISSRILPATRILTATFLILTFINFVLMKFGIYLPLPPTLFYLLAFLFTVLLCHQELSHIKPAAKNLTEFYLIVSLGGVLGGVFNVLLAPAIFNLFIEYYVILSLLPFVVWKPTSYLRAAIPVVYLVLIISVFPPVSNHPGEVLYNDRNYFGSLRVMAEGQEHFFVHGTTIHGSQNFNPEHVKTPTSYYNPEGPAGEIFFAMDQKNFPQKVAALGMGVGSIACYQHEGRSFDFYEINKDVTTIAEDPKYFRYLSDCGSPYKIILGDARLKIAQAPDHYYDLIFVDVFNSDNVPTHTITREAIELYLQKLKPGGIIAVHVSNKFIDLSLPLRALAQELGLNFQLKYSDRINPEPESIRSLYTESVYTVLTRNAGDFVGDKGWNSGDPNYIVKGWTDDYVDIFSSLIPVKLYKMKQEYLKQEQHK